MQPVGRAREDEIGPVGADAARQLGERLLDMRIDLAGPQADEARRDARDHMLQGRALAQRPGPRPKLQPEMDKNPSSSSDVA